MRPCPSCKREIPDDARFCPHCGAQIAAPPAEAAPQPPPPSPRETAPLPGAAAPTERLEEPEPAPPPAAAPPSAAAPPPGYVQIPSGGGSRVWVILGVAGALVVLTCVVLGIAVASMIPTFRQSSAPTVTVPTLRAPTPPPTGSTETPGSDPTATPPLIKGARVLLREDFDDPDASQLTEDTTDVAEFSFGDGTYVIFLHEPQYITWSTFNDTFEDVAIAVEARLDGPEINAASLLFHYQDDNNFYIFSVTGDQHYALELYEDGDAISLVELTPSDAIGAVGSANLLRVETEGDIIRLFVNDQLLEEVTSGAFTSGQVALAVNTYEEGDATVEFDNFVVSALEP